MCRECKEQVRVKMERRKRMWRGKVMGYGFRVRREKGEGCRVLGSEGEAGCGSSRGHGRGIRVMKNDVRVD